MHNFNIEKFYDVDGGEKLINPNNYPDEITLFLKNERKIILDTIQSSHCYDTLFEIGCMQARNIEISVLANVNYVGIDIVPRYIEEANIVISKSLINTTKSMTKKAIVKLLSVYELTKETTPISINSIPLTIFPFNSFGNMSNPHIIINNLVNLEYDFIIFTYKTDAISTHIRNNYYKNCNYTDLKQITEPIGIRFTAVEGLNTIAYYPDFIEKCLFEVTNYKLIIKNFGTIGILFYGSKIR